ncbi:hypothetical protein ABW20_dc0110644 [Dactylellina cionopaga]|nr:hypothetical protein ABW20_dc0110644 [Dactylellina cionopaga]
MTSTLTSASPTTTISSISTTTAFSFYLSYANGPASGSYLGTATPYSSTQTLAVAKAAKSDAIIFKFNTVDNDGTLTTDPGGLFVVIGHSKNTENVRDLSARLANTLSEPGGYTPVIIKAVPAPPAPS